MSELPFIVQSGIWLAIILTPIWYFIFGYLFYKNIINEFDDDVFLLAIFGVPFILCFWYGTLTALVCFGITYLLLHILFEYIYPQVDKLVDKITNKNEE